MKPLEQLVRKNITALKPYSCARDEFKGEAKVCLDANENPYGSPYNRYPDPRQLALKQKISKIKGIAVDQIMLGNGSDEPIDLVYRIFCEPGIDNVIGMAPSYGMYQVAADINNITYREVPLDEHFQMHAQTMLDAVDPHTKVIWCCSPNNPSGNSIQHSELEYLLTHFEGIVVIDEAYIDFSAQQSWLQSLNNYPNLIVLQTFSKAWGMASVRCGMAFASTDIIQLFNKVKYPYNINLLTQQFVSQRLDEFETKNKQVQQILEERTRMQNLLPQFPCVEKVYPSDANFLLVKVNNANAIYQFLVEQSIIVRNRNSVLLCQNGLRITIGTYDENNNLINALKSYSSQQ